MAILEATPPPNNNLYWTVDLEYPSHDTVPPTPKDPSKDDVTKGLPFKKSDDELCSARLLNHLQNNQGYYNSAVWLLMDAVERRLYLENALQGRPDILNGMDDKPLAISGNYVAFPYNGPLARWEDSTDEIPTAPVEDIVTLPTRGLFAEAQMGHCNSCEKRDVTRMWDWTEMTAETPPDISGISPGPKGTAPSITPGQLPGNVIQITTPQAAPDPTGLANALNVLKTPDIFRDMAGLDDVSKLLGEMVKDATDANTKAMGTQAQVKIAEIQAEAKKKAAEGNNNTGAAAPSGVSAADAADRFSLLPEIKSFAKDIGLTDEEYKQFALDQMYGTKPTDKTPKGTTPIPKGGTSPAPMPLAGTPFMATSLRIAVKSFIGRVGGRVGTAPCGTGGISYPQLLLEAFAAATDSSFDEDPTDDRIVSTREPASKGYRLLSILTLAVVHDQEQIPSVAVVDFEMDGGREPVGGNKYAFFEAPPLIPIDSPTVTQVGSNIWNFSWAVKGRPPVDLEPGLQLICPRACVFIWHRVKGEIVLRDDPSLGRVPVVSRLELTGSQFPSHRAFVNGAVTTNLPQGELARLWDADPTDGTKVK